MSRAYFFSLRACPICRRRIPLNMLSILYTTTPTVLVLFVTSPLAISFGSQLSSFIAFSIRILFSGRTFPPFKYLEMVARDNPVLSFISLIVDDIFPHLFAPICLQIVRLGTNLSAPICLQIVRLGTNLFVPIRSDYWIGSFPLLPIRSDFWIGSFPLLPICFNFL